MDEIRLLAVDLSEVPVKTEARMGTLMAGSAQRVKERWRANERRRSGRSAPAEPSSITFDVEVASIGLGFIEAVIGPDKALRQGPLGNLLEFGSVNNPPHNYGGRALKTEAPKLEHDMAALALETLGWR